MIRRDRTTREIQVSLTYIEDEHRNLDKSFVYIFVFLYSHSHYNDYIRSVASIAKAQLCLSRPSIIISFCRTICHPITLWLLSLSFTKPEPRLQSITDSRGNPLLPARVSTIIIFICINFMFYFTAYAQITNDLLKNCDKFKIKNDTKIKQSILHLTQGVIKLIMAYKWSEKSLIMLCGDVERNPGPIDISLVTLNCRGLKNKEKFNQLMTRLQNSHPVTSNLIIALQETHVEKSNLKFKWKGNYIFTEGLGSQGGGDNTSKRQH